MFDMHSARADKLQILRDVFAEQLPKKLEDIQNLWNQVKQCKDGVTLTHETLRRKVHSLVGSAGTFGFNTLSERSRELEIYLQKVSNNPQGEDLEISVVDKLLVDMKLLIAQGPENTVSFLTTLPSQGVSRKISIEPVVYVLEVDCDLGKEIVKQCRSFGYDAHFYTDSAALIHACQHKEPDALIAPPVCLKILQREYIA